MVDIIAVRSRNLLRTSLSHTGSPLVYLGVTVGERKAAGAIVVSAGNIYEGGRIRVKKAGVVHAVRVLINKDPRVSGPWVKEIRGFFKMFVNRIPRAVFGIPGADGELSGEVNIPSGFAYVRQDGDWKISEPFQGTQPEE